MYESNSKNMNNYFLNENNQYLFSSNKKFIFRIQWLHKNMKPQHN